jgi:hypothetical protein
MALGSKKRINPISGRENEAAYSAGARNDAPNNLGWAYASNVTNAQDKDFDGDLYRASIIQRYLQGEGGLKNQIQAYAGDMNTDVARSAMNNLLARAGQRREMKGQLAGLGDMQRQEEDMVKSEGARAIGQGVKNTRQNFNQRGLLYGGMREGGEGAVKAQGAATVAQNLSGVKRDYSNQADALKRSIAQLGLASQKEAQERQAQVMEQSMRNQIARQQAYQQLGEGVGYAAGAYYGSRDKAPTDKASDAGFNRPVGGSRYITPDVGF